MYRHALIAVKPTSGQQPFLENGIQLAAKHHWKLTACTVIDEETIVPSESIPIGAGEFKKQRDERLMENARKLGEEQLEFLRRQAQEANVCLNIEFLQGDTSLEVSRLSKQAELLICGHRRGSNLGSGSLLLSILRSSPRPALIVPEVPTSGRETLIAYDGSFQAARAVASFAYSGLAQGAVHLISLHRHLKVAEENAEGAKTFLDHCGIHTHVTSEQMENSLGERILEFAQSCQAGLIVMGAFGQMRLKEFLFGSVTQTILQNAPCPVFLDH